MGDRFMVDMPGVYIQSIRQVRIAQQRFAPAVIFQ